MVGRGGREARLISLVLGSRGGCLLQEVCCCIRRAVRSGRSASAELERDLTWILGGSLVFCGSLGLLGSSRQGWRWT